MKSIGILCSGGDGPGMNACIRAIVRSGVYHKKNITGIMKGYSGILEQNFIPMDLSSVGNIIQRGGTILQTSRCPEWRKSENRAIAAKILKEKKIDALIVLGGDGSFNGAYEFNKEHNFPIIGIPCTIDNDISGTEYTIGFETAVNTAMESVDKIRDTASSHARTFLVEVMGRESAAIAEYVGLCTGAENIVLPGSEPDIKEIYEDIKRGLNRGKNSSIIIVAEGKTVGISYHIQEELKKKYQHDSKVCILGHTQRGGNPCAKDRMMASLMGYAAIDGLIRGNHAHATCSVNSKIELLPIEKCITKMNASNIGLHKISKVLSI